MKGLTNITGLVFGVIIAVACLQGLFLFYNNLFNTYSASTLDSMNATYHTELLEYGENITGQFESSEDNWISNLPFFGDIADFLTIGWKAVTMFWDMPATLIDVFSSSISAGSESVTMPDWISFILNSIIWLIIVVALIKAVFKREI